MAVSAFISGTVRVSGILAPSAVLTRAFSAIVTASAWFQNQYTIDADVSEFVVSLDTLSNPGFVVLFATQTVRVNYGNHPSATSHASAGNQFKDLWAQIGSGISGPQAFHFSNSGSDSAIVTMIVGM